MDVQFWIYIIIGVIYFLSKLLKKPEQEPGAAPEAPRPERGRRTPVHTEQASERPKQLTFEELLREITEGKQTRTPERTFQPEPEEYQSYETVTNEEARSLEDVSYNEAEDARVFKAYEDAKRQVFDRRSLEETLRLEDTVIDFQKFGVFESQNKRNLSDDYRRSLRNPESLKQAVVMSEILKRKF